MNRAFPAGLSIPERPRLRLCGGAFGLVPGRVHEVCGRARWTFAMLVAAAVKGPVMWIGPEWRGMPLNPDGMRPFVDPARFLFAAPQRLEDVLWTMEEALRSGAVPLVMADLPAPPALTPVRRLQLAAEAAACPGGGGLPLGLLLTPGDGGAPGVESRWQMEPAHRPQPAARASLDGRWTLRRLRARTEPEAGWVLTGPGQGGALAALRRAGEPVA